jgi:hypothetical protein
MLDQIPGHLEILSVIINSQVGKVFIYVKSDDEESFSFDVEQFQR